MYFVYALYNKERNKIYIGQTSDLQNRLLAHQKKIFKNSFTAKNSGEWILIYSELLEDRRSALCREKQLKSYRGREFIKQQIPKL